MLSGFNQELNITTFEVKFNTVQENSLMCFKKSPHSTLFTAGNVHLIRKKYVIKQISKQTFYHIFIEIETKLYLASKSSRSW